MAKIRDVKGVFFDYGGVVEDVHFDEVEFRKGVFIISDMVRDSGIRIDSSTFYQTLRSGQKAYDDWYRVNDFRELPNEEIWSSFLLKEQCGDTAIRRSIEERAEELSSIYEFYLYKRRPPKGMLHVLKTLFQNRYIIAMVSNTMSRTLIPERLRKFGIDRYFATVVLSVEVGVRKPNRTIFEHAFRQTGLLPEQCIYVGDTLSRDVEGSKRAGCKYSILIHSGLTEMKDKGYRGDAKPDHRLKKLSDLIPLLT
jgi:putative hydrolase of the HAD superfamily